MFFVRYDVDGDFQFNNSETGRILDDLDHNRVERVPETSNETDLTRYYKEYQGMKLLFMVNSKYFIYFLLEIIKIYSHSRPKSGKEARQQRSKSILSLIGNENNGARGNVSIEEFNVYAIFQCLLLFFQ